MILLIYNYDSFTYNIYQYVSEQKNDVDLVKNNQVNFNKIDRGDYSHIIISPGPGTPIESGQSIDVIKKYHKKIPILGVCLGHQIIGQVFKSKIIVAKKLMHGKTSLIKHKGLGIFRGIKKNISATRYHSLIIDRKSVGKDLIITAETKDKTIMGIMHKKYNVHGVQFHPESIKTNMGMKILKNFINHKI